VKKGGGDEFCEDPHRIAAVTVRKDACGTQEG